jgi:hypothetical protein
MDQKHRQTAGEEEQTAVLSVLFSFGTAGGELWVAEPKNSQSAAGL